MIYWMEISSRFYHMINNGRIFNVRIFAMNIFAGMIFAISHTVSMCSWIICTFTNLKKKDLKFMKAGQRDSGG